LHLPIWTTFHSEFIAFVGLFIISFTAKYNNKNSWRLVIIGVLLITFAAVANNNYRGDYFLLLIYFIGGVASYNIGKSQEKNAELKLLNSVLFLFIAGGLLTSIIIYSQFFDTEYFSNGYILNLNYGRPFGNLAQPNQAATLVVMGWMALCFKYETNLVRKYFFAIGSILMLTAVIITQSRTAVLTIFFVTLGSVLMIKKYQINEAAKLNSEKWLFIFFIFIIITLLFHYLPLFSEKVIGIQAMASKGTRLIIWKQVVAGLVNSPWFGYGLLQTSAAQQMGSHQVPGLEQTGYSHNIFLDLFVWFGVPLGIIFIVGVAWWLRTIWYKNINLHCARLFIFVIPFAIHSLLEMPFSYAYFLFPVLIILGLIESMSSRSTLAYINNNNNNNNNNNDDDDKKSSGSKKIISFNGLIPLILIFFCSLTAWDYFKIEEDFRVVRFENMRIGQTPDDYHKPNILILNQLGELMESMRIRAKPGMTDYEIDTLKRVSLRYPWAPIHFRLTLSLALNRKPELAADQLKFMKNFFGPDIYHESISNLVELEKKMYPELKETLSLLQ
jgi:hypothetical protein